MKILIIGGTGYLSSAVVAGTLEAGHQVAAVTRGQRGVLAPEVEALVVDRDDSEALRQAVQGRQFDAVIDTICYRPEQAQAAVDIFRGRVGRYVMISTDFVYGIGSRPLPTPESMARDTPNKYGQAKAAAEDVFLGVGSDLPATVLRPPHIVGGAGLLGTGSLEGRDANLTVRLKAADPVILLDGGGLLIQPAERRDITSAALAVVQAPAAAGRVFNVAGPRAVTSLQYYEIVAAILGVQLRVISLPADAFQAAYPERAVFAVHRAYDTRALYEATGWTAQVTLETSLREMVENRLKAETDLPEKPAQLLRLVANLESQSTALTGLLRDLA